MRSITSVVIISAGLLLAGCGSHPLPNDPDAEEIESEFDGTWVGKSYAKWPGPDDGLLVAEELITFHIDSGSFVYIEGPPDIIWIPIPGPQMGSGTFDITDGQISLNLEHVNTNYTPFHLSGQFTFDLDGEDLTLFQIIPGFFTGYHRLTLTRYVPFPPG